MHMRKKSWLAYAAVLILGVSLIASGCGSKSASEDSDWEEVSEVSVISESLEMAETEPEEKGFQFPFELEDGRLLVNSLFQSSIDNPDNGDTYGDDIASLEVENASSEFCESLQITVSMPDGRQMIFEGSNIPAGKKAWLFEKNNQAISIQEDPLAIEGSAVFGEDSLMADRIAVSVEDTTVILQNISSEELFNLNVGCHCMLEDTYYGGLTYEYPVAYIGAGETVTIDAAECYLGSPDPVTIQTMG